MVDNNSKDNTKKTLDKLNVTSYFQIIQGCGPARQMGMEQARGKYILLADADCVYPSCWLDEMMKQLTKPGVVCVYGRYSFLSEPGFPRWKLWMLEKMKDVIAELRHFKRPYLNTFGISMGYVRELGLKVGYIMHNTRGEDGRLTFDLMKYGKVKQVKADKARPWTAPRTLQRDGSFSQALKSRLMIESGKIFSFFTSHKAHDTKTSKNGVTSQNFMVRTQYQFDNVSLLITHYNRSTSLENLLKSFTALNCTFGEIVVSDDGSKVDHLKLLGQLKDTYKFKLITTAKNRGLGNNINKGQDAVTKSYTLYIQEDFEPSQEFPEKFAQAFTSMEQNAALDIVKFYAYYAYPYLKPFNQDFDRMYLPNFARDYTKIYAYSDHPHLRRSSFF